MTRVINHSLACAGILLLGIRAFAGPDSPLRPAAGAALYDGRGIHGLPAEMKAEMGACIAALSGLPSPSCVADACALVSGIGHRGLVAPILPNIPDAVLDQAASLSLDPWYTQIYPVESLEAARVHQEKAAMMRTGADQASWNPLMSPVYVIAPGLDLQALLNRTDAHGTPVPATAQDHQEIWDRIKNAKFYEFHGAEPVEIPPQAVARLFGPAQMEIKTQFLSLGPAIYQHGYHQLKVRGLLTLDVVQESLAKKDGTYAELLKAAVELKAAGYKFTFARDEQEFRAIIEKIAFQQRKDQSTEASRFLDPKFRDKLVASFRDTNPRGLWGLALRDPNGNYVAGRFGTITYSPTAGPTYESETVFYPSQDELRAMFAQLPPFVQKQVRRPGKNGAPDQYFPIWFAKVTQLPTTSRLMITPGQTFLNVAMVSPFSFGMLARYFLPQDVAAARQAIPLGAVADFTSEWDPVEMVGIRERLRQRPKDGQ